jgi:predicted Fe-Mo cluster-binding NifX family protein
VYVLKVGVVTDDGQTISAHFGRAQYYLVYDIVDGTVRGKETRPKASHHQSGIEPHAEGHHHGQEEASLHNNMLSNVRDCEALIARGMGWGMYEAITQSGLKPFLTEIASADQAIEAYIKGSLDDHTERLH